MRLRQEKNHLLSRNSRTLMAPLLLVALVGCSAGAESYRGDGRARSAGSWINPALIIEFEDFPLDHEYQAEYRFENMPSSRGNFIRFGISPVEQPAKGIGRPSWATDTDLGTLRFIVFGENGRTILDCETDVRELTWLRLDRDSPFGTRKIEPCPNKLLEEDLRPGEPKTLEVRYVPGRDSPADRVRVRIQAGGTTA